MLPPEVVFHHILPRVPARSVIRLMLVSEQWHSFISTPIFKKMHQTHAINGHNYHEKLLLLSTTIPYKFSCVDCEHAPKDVGLTTSHYLPFEIGNASYIINILASFHGLVCVLITDSCRKYVDLILWNPLTGEHKTLSKPNHLDYYYRSSVTLYYSSSDDDYKLLMLTYSGNVYIYSLKSDSWRTVAEDFQHYDWFFKSHQWPCICLNETLYFLAESSKRDFNLLQYSVIRFDTKTETFTLMAPPFVVDLWSTWSLAFTALEGCLHLCVSSRKSSCDRIDLWRMDGDREWTNVATYNYPRNSPRLVDPQFHVTRNGKLLMYSKNRGYIYTLDLEKKNKVLKCSAIGENIIPKGIYIESLVSPNRYTK